MTAARKCPALYISAPASHQGKTAVTAGLARYYKNRGWRVRVFKTGPDFLDPMLLERASGNPVYQLDLWMIGEQRCRELLWNAAGDSDVILIEGVLGLHDGTPSSADLARLLDVPVALVINAAGMAQSIHAVAHGLATYQPVGSTASTLRIAGVIANQTGSARHEQMIADGASAHLPVLAFVRRNDELTLPSRHLGLVQAAEIEDLDLILDKMAEQFADSHLATLPAQVEFPSRAAAAGEPLLAGLRIAVARDAAFSFIYRDNLNWLLEMGAELKFFSPLADNAIPDADVVYLPGGYPELHAHELSRNRAMQESLHQFRAGGGTFYAECGGMLYLLKSLITVDGRQHHMMGLLPGVARMGKRLASLGYQFISLSNGIIRGHTFHYSEIEAPWSEVLRATKHPLGVPGEAICFADGIFASYVHLYFRSAPGAAASIFVSGESNADVRKNPHTSRTMVRSLPSSVN
jgi:cobyrinic acid a,c-diamide synthase